jgi:hypothetical protein
MNSDDAAGYHLRIPPLSPVTWLRLFAQIASTS